MSKEVPPQINTNSVEFKAGVEAGLNSTENTKNWQAGNELGQALKDEPEEKASPGGSDEVTKPLFMRSRPQVLAGNAQDEKDGTEE